MSSDQHQSDPNGPAPRRGRPRVEGAKRTEILAAATERFGRNGYEDTAPFGSYVDMSLSLCMRKAL